MLVRPLAIVVGASASNRTVGRRRRRLAPPPFPLLLLLPPLRHHGCVLCVMLPLVSDGAMVLAILKILCC